MTTRTARCWTGGSAVGHADGTPGPRAVRLPTDPSVVTLARRAHAGTAVPQAPEALTGSPELPSLGDRGTLGRSGHATGGRWTAGGSTIDLVDNRSRSVLIMIIRTDGLPTRSVWVRSHHVRQSWISVDQTYMQLLSIFFADNRTGGSCL